MGNSDSDLEKAIGMAEDLLENVDAKYYEWLEEAEEGKTGDRPPLARPTSKVAKGKDKDVKPGSSWDWKEKDQSWSSSQKPSSSWQSGSSSAWSSSEKRSWQSDSYDARPTKWRR